MITKDDLLLQEIVELEAALKPMVRRLKELKEQCKDKGSFATDIYVCSVKEQTRTGLVGLERAIDALGREMLQSFDLIQTVLFKTVHVSRRDVIIDTKVDIQDEYIL